MPIKNSIPCTRRGGGDMHEWSDDYDLVGGCRENPGVFEHGGVLSFVEVCLHCGTRKIECDVPGESSVQITFENRPWP